MRIYQTGEQANNYRHGGHTIHKYEFNSYRAMKERCLNPKYRKYNLYGGRGIKICDQWLGKGGFVQFLHDMGKKPTRKHSIERIDRDGNYEPINCKWVTQRQQMANMSRNRIVTIDGISDTFTNHAARYGISSGTVHSRIRQLGWSHKKAFKTPTLGVGSNQLTYTRR